MAASHFRLFFGGENQKDKSVIDSNMNLKKQFAFLLIHYSGTQEQSNGKKEKDET
jgi:hypothetical protein